MLHTIANSDHHYAIYTMGFYIVFTAYYIVDNLLLKISPKYINKHQIYLGNVFNLSKLIFNR